MKLETKYTLTLPNGTTIELSKEDLDKLYAQLKDICKESTSTDRFKELADKLRSTPPGHPLTPFPTHPMDDFMEKFETDPPGTHH